MDQRFSAFFLEKYRLALQRGARSFYEDEISSEKVLGPNKLRRLMSRMVSGIMASSKMLKKKESLLKNPKRITNQSYME
jgi:hypothetical protein